MNPKVDFYFKKEKKWPQEIAKLRTIIIDIGLTEELKWGTPCYTFGKDNIVLIHTFKDYCALLFFKGSLLNNADGLLIQQTKNVQAARQMRFTSLEQIGEQQPIIKANIHEAIEVEKAGLQVELKKTEEYEIPEEFQRAIDTQPALKSAFYSLTPGRQRGYLLYFSSAKQAKTREGRIEKYIPQILKGKGVDD